MKSRILLLCMSVLFIVSCSTVSKKEEPVFTTVKEPTIDSNSKTVKVDSVTHATDVKKSEPKKVVEKQEKKKWEHEEYGDSANFMMGAWSYVGSFRHWVKSWMPSWWYTHDKNHKKSTYANSVNNKER